MPGTSAWRVRIRAVGRTETDALFRHGPIWNQAVVPGRE